MILNLTITPKVTLRKLGYSSQRNLMKFEPLAKFNVPKLQKNKIEESSL